MPNLNIEKIKRIYVSLLSLTVGLLAAYMLYSNINSGTLDAFSFEDARVSQYERPYSNLLLTIFSIPTAIGGILYGIVGLLNINKTDEKNEQKDKI
jgi:hypothetical protein